MRLRDLPIQRKLMMALLMIGGLVSVLTCAGFLTYEIITLRKSMVEGYTTRAEIIAANSTAALAFQNEADATQVLEALQTDPRVIVGCLYDAQGNLFAKYPANAITALFPPKVGLSGYRDRYLETFCPVVQGGRTLGTVYLQSDLSALTDRYQAYAWLTAAILAGSFLAAYLLSRVLQKQISLPILALAGTARAISIQRDYSVRAQKLSEDELGLLTDAFNRMLEEILAQNKEIAERTRLLDLVMNSMSEGVVVADPNGRMTFFNAAAAKIVGLGKSSQAPSKWVEEYGVFQEDKVTPFSEKDIPLVRAIQGLDTDNQVQFLRNATYPQGVFVSVNGRPLKDEKGEVMGGLVVIRDINEERKVSEKMRSYTRRLEESNRDLQDFVFVASHDLQEPLRKIQSFGNFLKDEAQGKLSAEGADYLHRMQDAARRMGLLIEDLLQITRVTTRAKPFEPVELSQILSEVVSDLEIRIQETHGKVVLQELPRLEADPSQMRQLFQNLVGNALKFHKKDTPPLVEVRSRVNGSREHCVIEVKDNGIGFDPKYAEKVFNIFQRLNGSEYEGTGIGLAVCRKVVERHNGTIAAKSYLGQGALFEVQLPLRQNPQGGKA